MFRPLLFRPFPLAFEPDSIYTHQHADRWTPKMRNSSEYIELWRMRSRKPIRMAQTGALRPG